MGNGYSSQDVSPNFTNNENRVNTITNFNKNDPINQNIMNTIGDRTCYQYISDSLTPEMLENNSTKFHFKPVGDYKYLPLNMGNIQVGFNTESNVDSEYKFKLAKLFALKSMKRYFAYDHSTNFYYLTDDLNDLTKMGKVGENEDLKARLSDPCPIGWTSDNTKKMGGRLTTKANNISGLNAWNGSYNGADARLNGGCSADSQNKDCAWDLMPDGRLTTTNKSIDPNLGLKGGVGQNSVLTNECGPGTTDPNCLWKVSDKGHIATKANPNAGLYAEPGTGYPGNNSGAYAKQNSKCTSDTDDANCLWQFSENVNSYACKAPDSYNGPCDRISHFPPSYYNDSAKEQWSNSCNAPWYYSKFTVYEISNKLIDECRKVVTAANTYNNNMIRAGNAANSTEHFNSNQLDAKRREILKMQSNLNQQLRNISDNYNNETDLYNIQSRTFGASQTLLERKNRMVEDQLKALDAIGDTVMTKDRLIRLNYDYDNYNTRIIHMLKSFFVFMLVLVIPLSLHLSNKMNRGRFMMIVAATAVAYVFYVIYYMNKTAIDKHVNKDMQKAKAYGGLIDKTIMKAGDYEVKKLNDLLDPDCDCPDDKKKAKISNMDSRDYTEYVERNDGVFYFDGTAPSQQLVPEIKENQGFQIDWTSGKDMGQRNDATGMPNPVVRPFGLPSTKLNDSIITAITQCSRGASKDSPVEIERKELIKVLYFELNGMEIDNKTLAHALTKTEGFSVKRTVDYVAKLSGFKELPGSTINGFNLNNVTFVQRL